MNSPGNQLEILCSQAQTEVVLAAPFIKFQALARLLSQIPDEAEIHCFTRWRPEEVVAGVSDIEIWTLLSERPHTSLWLRPDLHAKYYRFDQQCLIGSANITSTALGWHTPANLEILVSIPANHAQLTEFEAGLFSCAIQVSHDLFEQMQQIVELLRKQHTYIQPTSEKPEATGCDLGDLEVSSGAWLPILRNPGDLYPAYSGQSDSLSSASQEAASLDLKALAVPANLSKEAFYAYVCLTLLQKPIIYKVDIFLENSQRFGAVTDFLSSLPCALMPNFDVDRAWQTLMRWLQHFFPGRYKLWIPNHSEVFEKVKSTNSINPKK